MSLATSLYDALTGINIPKDQARNVVEALEHKMTAEFATKSDIALLRADIATATTEMKAAIALVLSRLEQHEALTKAEFAAIRSDVKAEFAAIRSEVKAESAAFRSDVKAEFAAFRSEAKSESAALRSEMHAIETRTFIRLGGLMVILLATVPKVLSWLGW